MITKNIEIQERAISVADYIINNSATVRMAGKQFGISKSTVHKDVTERLWEHSPILAEQVNAVLSKNKAERSYRGGLATKKKYALLKNL